MNEPDDDIAHILDVTTRHEAQVCVTCERELDATSGSASPAVGDITVCIYCATVYVFDEAIHLRVMTADEIKGLPQAARQRLNSVTRLVHQLGGLQRRTRDIV